MPAHDRDHDAVCAALVADGWTITADPLHLRYAGDDLYVDLAAERLIAAEKGPDREEGDRSMDPVAQYRETLIAVLRPWEERARPPTPVRFQTVFDRERDRYLVVAVGWDGRHHVDATLIHVDIVDGKLWIQHDQTETGIAPDLVAGGVPRDRIVLGFKSPARRALTDYAVS